MTASRRIGSRGIGAKAFRRESMSTSPRARRLGLFATTRTTTPILLSSLSQPISPLDNYTRSTKQKKDETIPLAALTPPHHTPDHLASARVEQLHTFLRSHNISDFSTSPTLPRLNPPSAKPSAPSPNQLFTKPLPHRHAAKGAKSAPQRRRRRRPLERCPPPPRPTLYRR